ncbi:hypothetical protein [Lyticum sinuosum]|uniref:Uncharacterized protein n=1 Tax=Lyticum sinuosum TaxID=1332059 RepID=A0AAE4VKW4_9RICK|nr:hypothetical protein [Lyticum sinuosum]MDZ5761480.1 hypothetical protein [Lyticum sinuosum]
MQNNQKITQKQRKKDFLVLYELYVKYQKYNIIYINKDFQDRNFISIEIFFDISTLTNNISTDAYLGNLWNIYFKNNNGRENEFYKSCTIEINEIENKERNLKDNISVLHELNNDLNKLSEISLRYNISLDKFSSENNINSVFNTYSILQFRKQLTDALKNDSNDINNKFKPIKRILQYLIKGLFFTYEKLIKIPYKFLKNLFLKNSQNPEILH